MANFDPGAIQQIMTPRFSPPRTSDRIRVNLQSRYGILESPRLIASMTFPSVVSDLLIAADYKISNGAIMTSALVETLPLESVLYCYPSICCFPIRQDRLADQSQPVTREASQPNLTTGTYTQFRAYPPSSLWIRQFQIQHEDSMTSRRLRIEIGRLCFPSHD